MTSMDDTEKLICDVDPTGVEETGRKDRTDSEEIRKKARLRLLGLLQRRAYTEYQLRDKLSKSGYTDIVIDDAIAYVKDLRLIDDYKYCRDYITYSSVRKSYRKARREGQGRAQA